MPQSTGAPGQSLSQRPNETFAVDPLLKVLFFLPRVCPNGEPVHVTKLQI